VSALDKVKARLAEPSTHAGVAAALSVGMQFIPWPYSWIVAGIAGVFGITAAVKADPQKSPP
jgi:membrane-associated phospholipid phosphatase